MPKLYGLVLRTATEIESAKRAVGPERVGKGFMEELETGKIHREKREMERSK